MSWYDNQTMQTILLGMTVVASVLSFATSAFMWRMRATFVTKTEIGTAFTAVKVENAQALDRLAASSSALDKRVRDVEINNGSTAAKIDGVIQIVSRIDHMMGLLVEHRLRESEGG